MTWAEQDHARLATLFDGICEDDAGARGMLRPYIGYKPTVREAPNGDGSVDAGPAAKRYLHVALKYDPPAWAIAYLARAHFEACRVAEALGVPAAYYPRVADGTLRVLEYPSAAHAWHTRPAQSKRDARMYGPIYECMHCLTTDIKDDGRAGTSGVCPALAPGAGTAKHTDFDLFTIVLWRSTPDDLERRAGKTVVSQAQGPRYANAMGMSPGLHIGEIGELVGLGPATPHRVPARPYVQKSILYFAMPDHVTMLPDHCTCPRPDWNGHKRECILGQTVGEWLAERMARSRVYA